MESERPLIVTAGREFRDYPTLIDAVVGLDIDVVIASASPWSRRADNARDTDIPDNVTITKLPQYDLRDLYDRADLAVVPLQPVDFQAGITTILEAMSMELFGCGRTIWRGQRSRGRLFRVSDRDRGWRLLLAAVEPDNDACDADDSVQDSDSRPQRRTVDQGHRRCCVSDVLPLIVVRGTCRCRQLF